MFLVRATVVGSVGKFCTLAFLKALKQNLIISKKALLLSQKVAGITPLPPALVRWPCLRIYSIFILFTFLCKYNSKIDHKSKSNGNYKKLTNKRKNHRKSRRTKRYEKLSLELRVQILPSLEAKRYKRLRRIIGCAEDTG